MGKEIERKWLIIDPVPDDANMMSWDIMQGYLFLDAKNQARVRITFQPATNIDRFDKLYIQKCELTLKYHYDEISRSEFEYEIPENDAIELMGKAISIIRKRRDVFNAPPYSCVDHYYMDTYNDGLRVVEVEFDSVDDARAFDIPEWFGKEITGDNSYSNISMAKIPIT